MPGESQRPYQRYRTVMRNLSHPFFKATQELLIVMTDPLSVIAAVVGIGYGVTQPQPHLYSHANLLHSFLCCPLC